MQTSSFKYDEIWSNSNWWNLFPLVGIMNSSARSYDFSKDGNWLWVDLLMENW